MKIGELSDRTGVSARLLRYYEAQNLLGVARAENGYRDYPQSAVNRVLQIRELLESGFTTEIIRDILPCLDHTAKVGLKRLRPEVRQQLTAVRDRFEARIRCMERNRDAISAYLESVD
jgi:DNA-binding transcriptional MerR regulator